MTPRALKTIFFLDDDPDLIAIGRAAFKAVPGAEVTAFENALEAIAAMKANPPDLLVSDLNMDAMSGPDVLRALKGDPKTASIPVVFLSGDVDEALQKSVTSIGALGLVDKLMGMRKAVQAIVAMWESSFKG